MERELLGALERGELQVRGGWMVKDGRPVMPRLGFERVAPATSAGPGVKLSGAVPQVDQIEDHPMEREQEPQADRREQFMPPPAEVLTVSRAHADRHRAALAQRQALEAGLLARRAAAEQRSSVWQGKRVAGTFAPLPDDALARPEERDA
jgi:hypothetical protein